MVPANHSSIARWRLIALVGLYLLVPEAGGTEAPTPKPSAGNNLRPLQWMLGTWERDVASGARLTECWVALDERTYRGKGLKHTATGNVEMLEELLLAALGSDTFYQAKTPENAFPVSFRLVALGPSRAVFENPEHDFPQRLSYRLTETDKLLVRVEDLHGEGFNLRFSRSEAACVASEQQPD